LNRVLIIFFFSSLTFVGNCQKFKLGLTISPKMTNFYSGDTLKTVQSTYKAAINYGISGMVSFKDSLFFFQTGIEYSNVGFKQSIITKGGQKINDLSNNYFFKFPLYFRVEGAKFYLILGPSIELYRKTILKGALYSNSKFVTESPIKNYLGTYIGYYLSTGYKKELFKKVEINSGLEFSPSSVVLFQYPSYFFFNNVGLNFKVLYKI